ncbi:kinase-like domain-containing protein [Lentinula lateritia]|uniref:Kinase-like domain-containing protein n=1 Tax=Lentinula lateritia TaxID=40482 RepID=A0ABQ8VTT4_9AGAR|nr:kinase-like domain-containing protein [Lentinula lateritia]
MGDFEYHDRIIGPLFSSNSSDLCALSKSELWWSSHFEYLKEHGYMMRPRYRPGWKPSFKPGILTALYSEDGQTILHPYVMDALRISDSYMVAIKRVKVSTGEENIANFFSNQEHNTNPRNRCIRVLEVLPVPGNDDEKIIVMPWLRKVMDPRFRTIGEAVQFFQEIIQGLQYMHENNVAHRDCARNNMGMDANPMFTRQYHPIKPKKRHNWSGRALHHSRTRCPPTYFLIDFGQSRMYNPSQPRPSEYALKSGGYTPPEGDADIPCDPFATDVYILGTMIRTSFLDGDSDSYKPGVHGFEFLRPLVNDMIADDPSSRPTMTEVSSRFSDLVRKLPWWKLRSRAVQKDEFFTTPFRAVYHLFWTASMMLLLKPAIPSPKPLH